MNRQYKIYHNKKTGEVIHAVNRWPSHDVDNRRMLRMLDCEVLAKGKGQHDDTSFESDYDTGYFNAAQWEDVTFTDEWKHRVNFPNLDEGSGYYIPCKRWRF